MLGKKIFLQALTLSALFLCAGCFEKPQEKGFAVSTTPENRQDRPVNGLSKDSLAFKTKPSSVHLTGLPQYRLTTIYKVNYNDDNTTYIGHDGFYYRYDDYEEDEKTYDGNQWNGNFMPGFEAVYGFNMVNVAHYDVQAQQQKNFFEKPVLVKTLYYPTFSKDTLNYKPVARDYFMISVFDEDTNKDGYINAWDLRRFYYFDIHATSKRSLIPVNYNVFKSEYDSANDFMYVFAQQDENGNGQYDEGESIQIFWIDLKNPAKTGRLY